MNLVLPESLRKLNPNPEYDEAALDLRDAQFVKTVPARIAAETATVREQLAAGATYVVNGARNLVHDHTCPSLRHLLDRERAWNEQLSYILGSNRYALNGPNHASPKMPNLVTRDQVEQHRRYDVCQICSPDTDTRRKRHHTEKYTIVTAANLGRDYLGREIIDETERSHGTLDSVTLHITDQITTVTITHGTETTTMNGADTVRLRRRSRTTTIHPHG